MFGFVRRMILGWWDKSGTVPTTGGTVCGTFSVAPTVGGTFSVAPVVGGTFSVQEC